MADTAKVKTDNLPDRTEIKDLIKSGKAFSFVGQKIEKAYETEDGDYYIEAVASSDQEDLVGDIMSSKALRVMESDFIGKTVFMNHRTNVPDDVFGSIIEASIKNVDGAQLLIFKIIVEKENEAAMKTWRVIKGGRTQLGTSVTVMVKAAKPNPNRKGGIIIDDVETIEHSIVGVPCNRESKTMAASASKALNTAIRNKGTEEFMNTEEKDETMAATEDQETQAPAEVENKYFARTVEAQQKYAGLVEASKSGGELPEVLPTAVKGMFNEILERGPYFYELVDILNECRWNIASSVYLLRQGGSTDFSAPIAEWSLALEEFKSACIAAFPEWYEIESGVSKSTELIEFGESLIATLEKTSEILNSETADEKSKAQLVAIGTKILETAKIAGIPIEFESEAISADAPEVDVTETKEFKDMATRAEEAEAKAAQFETELSTARAELELSKAGLAAAVAATGAALREPLDAQRPKN